jgi:hypothetical protein
MPSGRSGAARRNASPSDRAAEVIGLFLASFRAIRRIEAEHASAFTSPGFTGFFELVQTQLDDAWLAEADDHVRRLRTRTLHVSAHLGPGNRGTDYVLHRRPNVVRSWRGRLGLEERRSTVEVLLSDQNAMNMIAELRALAIAPTAGAVHEAAQQVLAFFKVLRGELAFLVGCVNLREAWGAMAALHAGPRRGREPTFAARDSTTRLRLRRWSRHRHDHRWCALVVVTDANGGGKSTFLRAVGLAQLMTQAMFVTADGLRQPPRTC